MADEIVISSNFSAIKGSVSLPIRAFDVKIDWANARYSAGTLALTTTHSAIPLGNVSTPKVAVIVNTSSAGNVLVGKDIAGTFHEFASIEPGDGWPVPMSLAAPYIKISTGTGTAEYVILDD